MGDIISRINVRMLGTFTRFLNVIMYLGYNWWRRRDLNPGPTDYDSAALTTELRRHQILYTQFLYMKNFKEEVKHRSQEGQTCN